MIALKWKSAGLALAIALIAGAARAESLEQRAAKEFVAKVPRGDVRVGLTFLEGDEGNLLKDTVEEELGNLGADGVRLVERAEIDRFYTLLGKEIGQPITDADLQNLAQLGAISQMTHVVNGKVSRRTALFRDTTRINLKLWTLASGEIVAPTNVSGSTWHAGPLAVLGGTILAVVTVVLWRLLGGRGTARQAAIVSDSRDVRAEALEEVRRGGDTVRSMLPSLQSDAEKQAYREAVAEIDRLQRRLQEAAAGMPRARAGDTIERMKLADEACRDGARDLARRSRELLDEARHGDASRNVERLLLVQRAARAGIDALDHRGVS